MPSSDLGYTRRLLEQAERETDPARKFASLEEALDVLDDYIANAATSDPDRTYANNLRRSNVRRLLKQLVEMRGIQFDIWSSYIRLFLLRLEPEVKAILENDASVKSGYSDFVSLWKDELLDLLQRSA